MIKLTGDNADNLSLSREFQNWIKGFNKRTADIRMIKEVWSLWRGKCNKKIIFALLSLTYFDEKLRKNGVVFFRSDAAAAFLVVKNKDSGIKYVVLIEQLRIATGGKLLEIPAGSVEEDDDFLSTIVREVKEEVGLVIPAENFRYLGRYYPSPGACNEKIALYYCEHVLTAEEIEKLRGKHTGTPGENTKVKLYLLDNFDELNICDGKTLLAYHLYLKRVAKGIVK